MKKILAAIFCISILSTGFAQLDRSVRPEPGPAPKLNFGKYKVFELKNGLTVIVVEDHKLPRIAYNLIIDRDPIVEGDKAGYVSLAGDMLRQGTVNMPKDKLDQEIDFIGASLFTGSTNIYASGLSKYNDKILSIMSDVALNPAWSQAEFDKIKEKEISGIESNKDDPNYLSSMLFNRVVYGEEHPYGEVQTIETTEKVDLEDCKTYYNNYWRPNVAYLAIVGDIKYKDAKKMVKKYFGEWAQGNVVEKVYEKPAEPAGIEISMINRESSVQSNLALGNVIELKPGSPDDERMHIANQILGGGSLGRLYLNIREDKGFTYGAYSGYDDDEVIGEFKATASVRNEVTDSALTEFLYEFKRLQTENVSEKELQDAKNSVMGSFGRQLERPQSIASFALNIQRYNLPKDYYEKYPERIQAVTTADVKAAATKFMKTNSMHISVVGKAREIAENLAPFGNITYYDNEGNVTEAPSLSKPIPDGVTAETILKSYTNALGGKEKLDKVKDVEILTSVSIGGAPAGTSISGKTLKKRSGLFLQEISVAGMGTMQKMVYDGKTGRSSGMQGSQTLEGDDLEDLKMQGMLWPETKYAELGYMVKAKEIGEVDGEEAYVLEVTDKSGNTSLEYYSVSRGLKLRDESTEETPMGTVTSTVTYSDYKEANGVMFPYKTVIMQGPQKIEMTTTTVTVNRGIKDSEFK